MSSRELYNPGPADAARVEKNDSDTWVLILVKQLRHSPEKVWSALTEPGQLREWAPFDADKNLSEAGAVVKLTTVGAPSEYVQETTITRADAPKLLEYQWGGGDMRWELEPVESGTRLTLWANINRNYIAMGAAGWHLCLDVLEHSLDGDPLGRIVGPDALGFDGWQRLNKEYSEKFGVKPVTW
jgi:uncharacterized protein YndB with AHSA1/START domain